MNRTRTGELRGRSTLAYDAGLGPNGWLCCAMPRYFLLLLCSLAGCGPATQPFEETAGDTDTDTDTDTRLFPDGP
jgi:hypothetical protein